MYSFLFTLNLIVEENCLCGDPGVQILVKPNCKQVDARSQSFDLFSKTLVVALHTAGKLLVWIVSAVSIWVVLDKHLLLDPYIIIGKLVELNEISR